MAWDINRVVLVGRVSNEVDLRYTPSGAAVARFGVAVGGRPSKDGQDAVSFFTVNVWNKTAETAKQYLVKGSRIAIDGRLEQRSWTAQDGTRRSVVEIVAERFEFLSSPTQGGGQQSNYSAPPQQQQQTFTQQPIQQQEEYYDNTDTNFNEGFNDAPLDKYDSFDDEVGF